MMINGENSSHTAASPKPTRRTEGRTLSAQKGVQYFGPRMAVATLRLVSSAAP